MTRFPAASSKEITSFIFTFLILFAGLNLQNAFAEDTVAQKIVVSIKMDPYTEAGYEGACVAYSMGRLLAMNGADVTLFVTLAGAQIAHQESLFYIDAYADLIGKWSCVTSEGPKPLTDLVNGFVASGGNILVCPLCWGNRYGADAGDMLINGAVMGSPASLASTFLEADKVIDF
jgi:predicted peroxiredoxin